MKLNTTQKIYGSVLGIALCALVLDRGFGNSPPASDAAAIPTGTDPAVIGPPLRSPQPASGPGSNVLAQDMAAKLRTLPAVDANSQEIRDAFVPTPAWINGNEAEKTAPSLRATKFENSHRLKAIVESKHGGQAWVDDNLVAVGQTIDGFKLAAVAPMRAFFTDGEAEAELRLEVPDAPGQQALHSK